MSDQQPQPWHPQPSQNGWPPPAPSAEESSKGAQGQPDPNATSYVPPGAGPGFSTAPWGQSSYGQQPQYGQQSQYAQQSQYGQQPQYGQPAPSYGQPQYGQQPYAPPLGYPPPAPAKKKGNGILLAVLGLIVVAAAALVVILVAKPFGGDKSLSHTAVESYIKKQFRQSSVSCNGGKDFEMKNNGATFACSGDDSQSFTVTIKDKDKGRYEVS